MTFEQFQKHFKEINDFLETQNNILDLYKIKGLETKKASIEFLKDELIEPSKLISATIQYMVFSSANKDGAKNEGHLLRMQLIAAYLQGLFVSSELILEGSYIKASAVLKQDYEIMVQLAAIPAGNYKHGDNPNVRNAPHGLKRIYGHLNNIAHISKNDILEELLLFTDKEGTGGLSPVKKLNTNFLLDLFTFDTLIKLEILRHTLILHQEMFGENEVYEKALSHYSLILKIYDQTNIIQKRLDENKKNNPI